MLDLHAGALRLSLRPDLGASITGLWRGDLPVLRSTADPAALTTPRDSAGYVLAPYSNRLAYRQFTWLGRAHTVEPNFEGPHALHGVAWQRGWQVVQQQAAQAELRLVHTPDGGWPFGFTLTQRLLLQPDALQLSLSLTSTDPRPQPAGLGWHPYFPKRRHSRLAIDVSGQWARDEATQLPTRPLPHPGLHDEVRHLDVDHCFEGWTGQALITDECHRLRLSGPPPYLVVFTPPAQPFFCVEPVSHVSNALHLAQPPALGLAVLAPGGTLEATYRLEIAAA